MHDIGRATRHALPAAGRTRQIPTGPLRLYVVATTEAGTRAALEAARTLGAGMDAHVLLLVPRAVPYLEPLESPTASTAVATTRFRQIAERSALDVEMYVCLCRPDGPDLSTLVPPDGVVLVGGRAGHWLPTREQRLARRLCRDGYRVMFIESGRH